MSQLGHSRHFDGAPLTSGSPPTSDIPSARRHVPKVPTAEVTTELLISPSFMQDHDRPPSEGAECRSPLVHH